MPGHTAITTGVYQDISNDGKEYPQNPSFFQNWLKQTQQASSKAWIVTTKDKLEVLADCVNSNWKGTFNPMTDCGINGLGTGYRLDQTTFQSVKAILTRDHPKLMLINFKQPDDAGHKADSLAYLKGIIDTDNYVDLLWQALQGVVYIKIKRL